LEFALWPDRRIGKQKIRLGRHQLVDWCRNFALGTGTGPGPDEHWLRIDDKKRVKAGKS
jgi:hypothetical protein